MKNKPHNTRSEISDLQRAKVKAEEGWNEGRWMRKNGFPVKDICKRIKEGSEDWNRMTGGRTPLRRIVN